MPSQTTPAHPATRPDTHDMVVVHRVFRREFRLLPALVRGVDEGDATRAGVVGRHCAELVTALHHHHTGEDDLLWPKLRERSAMHSDLVAVMERQHHRVADLLAQVEQMLPGWEASPTAPARDRLAGILDEVSTALDEHLAQEEKEILPLAEEHLSVEEWGELGRRGMAAIPQDRLPVFLGYMLEEASASERHEMLGRLPRPARVLYRLAGQRKYRREVANVRAGVTVPEQRRATD